MTEAFSHPEPKPTHAEIIKFPGKTEIVITNASPDIVSAEYLKSLPKNANGYRLAEHIRESLRAENEIMKRISDLMQDVTWEDVEDKAEHDPVIKRVLSIIKTTTATEENRLQRRIILNLAEIRAAIEQDLTPDDDIWHDVINRLSSQ
jgi:hypothetical protein